MIVRVVQAGLGIWGRSWSGLVAGAPGVELAAVVDPDPEARRCAEPTPGYAVLEDALESVECDAVLVASPPGTHHGVVKAALEAGRHVLCEKPLATTLQDAFDLVETADRAERLLMVSQNYRYNAPFRAMQRLVMEGGLRELAKRSVVPARSSSKGGTRSRVSSSSATSSSWRGRRRCRRFAERSRAAGRRRPLPQTT